MKRIRIVGLCLAAVFAIGAMASVSSASAATFQRCVKVGKKGFYNAGCTEKNEKKGKPKGAYELKAVEQCEFVGKKGFYSDSACTVLDEKKGKPKGTYEKRSTVPFTASGPNGKLATPAFGPNDVECTASTTTGEITGPKTEKSSVLFTGCTLEGKTCTSSALLPGGEGQNAPLGDIKTNELESKLLEAPEKGAGYLHETPGAGKVWSEVISIEKAPYSAEFICETTPSPAILHTVGNLSGEDATVGALSTTGTTTFSELGGGEQALLTQVFNGTEFIPPSGAPSLELLTVTNTFAEPIEIKA